jgi:hypothetical protein
LESQELKIAGSLGWLTIPVAGVALCWFLNPEAWIADDSYFYLVIARNIARLGEQTFSGILPTNGAHPLWMYMMAAWASLLNAIAPRLLNLPHFAVALSATCLWLFAIQYRRISESLEIPRAWVLLPIAFTGVFGVLASEAHVSLLTLATFVWFAIQATDSPSRTNLLLLGCGAALAALARLDNVFAVSAVLFVVWVSMLRTQKGWAFVPAIVFLAAFGLYMASNTKYFGGAMPVSGWMKSSFPEFAVRGFSGGTNPSIGGVSIIWGWVPALVTAGSLWFARSRHRPLLFAMFIGVLAKNLYIVFFSRSHTDWYWYSTLDIFVLSLALALVLSRGWNSAFRRVAGPAAASVVLLFMTLKALTWELSESHPSAKSLAIIRGATEPGDSILVSDWPGRLAFFLPDRRVFAADLLTANRRWYRGMARHGDAFDFLYRTFETAGHPLTHLLLNGNHWLEISEDERRVTFNDPRRYPERVSLGELQLRSPPTYRDGKVRLWRIDRRAGKL